MRPERGATALATLAAAAAIVGAALPWRPGVAIGPGAPGGEAAFLASVTATTGALVAFAVHRARDWSVLGTAVVVGGGVVTVVGLGAVTRLGHSGGGAVLTALAGATMLLAGAVGVSASVDPSFPRPLRHRRWRRRRVGYLAGASFCGVVAAYGSHALTVSPSPDAATVIWLAYLGAVGIVGGGWAWSRPVAAAWLPIGAVATLAAPLARLPAPPRWAAGVVSWPLGGALLFVAGLALTAACVAEVGGGTIRTDGRPSTAGSRARSGEP